MMWNLLLLASAVTLAFAAPLQELSPRQSAFCPNITVTSVGAVGDGCGAFSYSTSIFDYDTGGGVLFDDFGVYTEFSDAPTNVTISCTVYFNLGYPLPVAQGCPNTGNFFLQETGEYNLAGTEPINRIVNVDYPDGSNAQFFDQSTTQSFRQTRIQETGPRSGGYQDSQRTTFTFASASNGAAGGAVVQDLVTVSVYLQLDLFSGATAYLALDSMELKVETDGYSLATTTP